MPNDTASDQSLANLIAEARANFIRRTADVVDGHEEQLVDAFNNALQPLVLAVGELAETLDASTDETRRACHAATVLHVEASQLRHSLALANGEIERREREHAALLETARGALAEAHRVAHKLRDPKFYSPRTKRAPARRAREGMAEDRVGTVPGSGIPLPHPPFGMSDGEAREAARVRAESFCACGRRLPECDGSRAGCTGPTGSRACATPRTPATCSAPASPRTAVARATGTTSAVSAACSTTGASHERTTVQSPM